MESTIVEGFIPLNVHDDQVDTTLPPFDGKPVLIQTRTGVIEAYWEKHYTVNSADGVEHEGHMFVCYDDAIHEELSAVIAWAPLTAPKVV